MTTMDLTQVQGAVAEMLRHIAQRATEGETRDGSQAAMQITAQILSAETTEDILAAAEFEGNSTEDLVGIPLRITAVQWVKSNLPSADEGFPFFAIVTATDLMALADATFTTGARSILTQLYQFDARGQFPVTAEIKCKLSLEGNTFYYLSQLSKVNKRYANNGNGGVYVNEDNAPF